LSAAEGGGPAAAANHLCPGRAARLGVIDRYDKLLATVLSSADDELVGAATLREALMGCHPKIAAQVSKRCADEGHVTSRHTQASWRAAFMRRGFNNSQFD
jgi:hypothetical protein